MKENKVEDLDIVNYRSKLFNVFNLAALESGMGGFKFQTDEEERNEFLSQIEDVHKQGYSL